MARRKQWAEEADGGTATLDRPPALGNYRITFRGLWLPVSVIVEGCADEADARAKLHELVDQAVIQIERSR